MRSTLCYDQAIKWAKAKARVYSDSVLCLGKMHDHSETNEKWTSQIREFQQTNEYAELSGIDGEPIEFEWNIFPRFTSIEILWKIQEDLEARQINPEQLEGRILFMSMFNDMDRTKNGNSLDCILNSKDATDYAKRFQRGHGGSEENGMERTLISQKENGTLKPIRWHQTLLQKVVIPYSVVQVRPNEESWGETVEEIQFISQRNQQTMNIYFAQFIRQISSVSTEQYRVGVMR